MPAMHYTVRWPDASQSTCYSPSLIVQELLAVGGDYALPDFMARIRQATAIANERVRAKYGFACSRASDQLRVLEAAEQRFSADRAARVQVLSFGAAD
jgi:uncharacterized repeat protein (TIGR04042 family)